ncbi:MAG: hypothetical protein AB1571_01260 [Nanoarchaeota archaeon]
MTNKMETKHVKIKNKAIELLEKNPNGIRYSELVRMISKEFPEIPINTIRGAVWDLDRQLSDRVYKPARGIFRLIKFKDIEIKEEKKEILAEPTKFKEESFYKPFTDWLVNETEEATKAIPLGGNKFKDKWGTPDVIGIRESRKSDIIKIPTEIISAEIKTDSTNLITAFGQACSYRLFSHSVYLVIPKQSSETDILRLDALSLIFGIGLVLFDLSNKEDPNFEIRVRPIKHNPDIFYTNEYLKLIEKELFG